MRKRRVLVCGGRDFTDINRIFAVLDHYNAESGGFANVIHGAARGADTLADAWAKARNIKTEPYPVTQDEWNTLGKSAGHLRNAKMLREGCPDVVIAFPGENGTANMIGQAERAGVPVLRIP